MEKNHISCRNSLVSLEIIKNWKNVKNAFQTEPFVSGTNDSQHREGRKIAEPLIPPSVDNMEIFLYQFVSSLGRSERDQMT